MQQEIKLREKRSIYVLELHWRQALTAGPEAARRQIPGLKKMNTD